MVKDLGGNRQKPKKYSRKKYICSCECPVYSEDLVIDRIMVQYEIMPNKELNKYTKVNQYNTGRWGTSYAYWGTFKRVVDLSIVNKMNDEDYIVKTSTFTRDNVQVPFICGIEVLNGQKYESIKIQHQRKGKLKKLRK